MTTKRSVHELRRLVEAAVAESRARSDPGLWFSVDHVEAHGNPPDRLRVWATLHFLTAGNPFCCGEPECHLGLTRLQAEIDDHVRRAMALRHAVRVEFGDRIQVRYHPGVEFRTHSDPASG